MATTLEVIARLRGAMKVRVLSKYEVAQLERAEARAAMAAARKQRHRSGPPAGCLRQRFCTAVRGVPCRACKLGAIAAAAAT